MTAVTLDGKATLAAIKAELAERIATLRAAGVVPGLGTVLVGDDPGSRWYVNAKHKDSAEIGIASIERELPATATLGEVLAVVDELNADPECTAFLVQQPTGLDEFAILSRVDPAKDVDGLHPFNLGALVLGEFTIAYLLLYTNLQVTLFFVSRGTPNAGVLFSTSSAALLLAFVLLLILSFVGRRRGGQSERSKVSK